MRPPLRTLGANVDPSRRRSFVALCAACCLAGCAATAPGTGGGGSSSNASGAGRGAAGAAAASAAPAAPAGAAGTTASAASITTAAVHARALEQVPAVLESLKALVAIESGSRDLEGLERIAALVAGRLAAAGMAVQTLPAQAPSFNPQLKGAKVGPMVMARKAGTGKRRVLLIAHMDTVYPRGMGARQPFRVEGDRAYGLGISDDKGGVALILHTVELLERMRFTDYAELAALINGDEEIGSAGSAQTITRLGREYDAVFSFEGGGFERDMVRLATGSIASVALRVKGKASHAGAAPERGRNALVEMAHQVLKTRGFGEDDKGLTINWTVATAGQVRNVIPADAVAHADVRALDDADLDRLEARLRQAIKDKLIPDTEVTLEFTRGRPAFRANAASRVLAQHARAIFKEMGLPLEIRDRASGGGTDAAYAGIDPKGGVLESFGLRGFGAHSGDEYVFISSIAPRLALAARMVMDVGSGKLDW
ncbi:MAG: M20/M25/M40 family metallo-hydrolase [Rubrivivax sp.]|nr:M20/M25/M40 family metallo-hydrolase [Rubrivivax sp.]